MYKKAGLITAIVCLACPLAEAWDATGHRLVAVIAYQHLSPQALSKVNYYTKAMSDAKSPLKRFTDIAVWPDKLYANGDTRFNHWHFVDFAYVKDGGHYHTYYPKDNAIYALYHCVHKLKSPDVSYRMKAHYLAFLVHVTGDIHQPLHCTTMYDAQFPKGDAGGNAYTIKSPIAMNLHHLWDQGVGLFHIKHQHYPLSDKNVVRLANQLQQRYPAGDFTKALADYHYADWARESFRLAKRDAYTVAFNGVPSKAYIAKGESVAGKRIVLAGLRLAKLLNWMYGGTNGSNHHS